MYIFTSMWLPRTKWLNMGVEKASQGPRDALGAIRKLHFIHLGESIVRKLVSPANLANCRPISCRANFIKPLPCLSNNFVCPTHEYRRRPAERSPCCLWCLHFAVIYHLLHSGHASSRVSHFPGIFLSLPPACMFLAKMMGNQVEGTGGGAMQKVNYWKLWTSSRIPLPLITSCSYVLPTYH